MISRSILILILACLLIGITSSQDQEQLNNEEFYKPNFSMDFKVAVNAWSLECYYLSLKEGEILHVIINVISGGDKLVDVLVDDPKGKRIFSVQDKSFEWFDSQPLNHTGDYKVCTNNPEVYPKDVYFNIVSVSKKETVKQANISVALNETQVYMEQRMINIAMSLFDVARLQRRQRIDHAGDWYYVEKNNEYVMYYSIAQSCLIVFSGLMQTYFIKKLFTSPKPKSIPKF